MFYQTKNVKFIICPLFKSKALFIPVFNFFDLLVTLT